MNVAGDNYYSVIAALKMGMFGRAIHHTIMANNALAIAIKMFSLRRQQNNIKYLFQYYEEVYEYAAPDKDKLVHISKLVVLRTVNLASFLPSMRFFHSNL